MCREQDSNLLTASPLRQFVEADWFYRPTPLSRQVVYQYVKEHSGFRPGPLRPFLPGSRSCLVSIKRSGSRPVTSSVIKNKTGFPFPAILSTNHYSNDKSFNQCSIIPNNQLTGF